MARIDENYHGLTRLREFWPKVKANFGAINKQVEEHVAGEADRHRAEDVTYSGPIEGAENVKEAVETAAAASAAVAEALEQHRTAAELDHPAGSVTDAHIGVREVDDPAAAIGTFRGALTALLNRAAAAVRSVRAALEAHVADGEKHITAAEREAWSGKVDKEEGKGLSSNDYTDAEKAKLAGIEAGATAYEHPTGDGWLHVPATGTTNAGKVLTAGAAPGSLSWQTVAGGGAVELLAAEAVIKELVIPMAGWAADEAAGLWYVDVALDGVTEDMLPVVSILPSDMAVAGACGMSPAACTVSGGLRLYAERAPEEDLRASVALLRPAEGNSGSGYELPAATAETLGGVKVGDGLSVTADGTLTVDNSAVAEKISATEEEASEMLAGVFTEQTE